MTSDLHLHSIHSNDGELRVEILIETCRRKQVNVIALTDHNSVRGVEQCANLCSNSDIQCIPGIEIDCSFEGIDFHLLGYNINWSSADFEELKVSLDRIHFEAFPKMVKNLASLGFHVDEIKVLDKANGIPPSPELIAEVLITDPENKNPLLSPYREGGKKSKSPNLNFYLDYLAQGKPAFVPSDYMDFKDALELILQNQGVPVIAHPGLNFNGNEKLVVELLNRGAAGLELFNNYHKTSQIEYFGDLARQRKVLMTCGSDFHGKNKPGIQPGQYLSVEKFSPYVNESIQQLTQ